MQQGTPKFPYMLTPNALSKFLDLIPKKPKPPKVDGQLLQSWDLRSNNDIKLVSVLREVGVLSADSSPTDIYEALMHGDDGKKQLAAQIRARYGPLFNADHEPYANDATATKLFNIHGGTQAPKTLQLMRQTFMALCKAADFSEPAKFVRKRTRGDFVAANLEYEDETPPPSVGPSVVINIQLTLPAGADEKAYDAFFASMKKHLWPSK